MLNYFVTFSKHHVIKKISYNLLDLKLHFYYGTSLTVLCWLINSTIKDTFLEMFYGIAGPDIAFQLWILGFLLESLGSLNIFSILVHFEEIF